MGRSVLRAVRLPLDSHIVSSTVLRGSIIIRRWPNEIVNLSLYEVKKGPVLRNVSVICKGLNLKGGADGVISP